MRILSTMALGLCLVAISLPQEKLTLDRAIELGLKNNRHLLAQAEQVNRANSKIAEARAGALPQVDATATYTRFDKVAKATFGPPDNPVTVPLGSIENRSANVKIEQIVDINGLVKTGLRTADELSLSARYRYEQAKSELILDIVTAFSDVLRAMAHVEVAEEAVSNAKERLRITNAQVDAGIAARFDVLRAETQVSQFEQQRLSAVNAVALAKANLNTVLARPVAEPIELDANIDRPAYLKDLALYTKQAREKRPEVLAAASDVKLSNYSKTIASAQNKPTLILNGQWNFNLNTATFNPNKISFTANAILSAPLFDAGIGRAKVRQAEADVRAAELTLQQTTDIVALEVQSALLNLEDAEKRIGVARSGMEQATEGLRLAKIRFEAGVSSPLEISDAEVAYAQARINLVTAEFDYIVSHARLMKATGTNIEGK